MMLSSVESDRLQKVLGNIYEYARRRGLDLEEIIAQWLEEKLELNMMTVESGIGR